MNTVIENFTEIDAYQSPEDSKRYLSEYFLLGSRWSLYVHFFVRIFQSRPLAVKGLYDDFQLARQCQLLLRNIEGCGGRFNITGLNNITRVQGPVIFISNHMGTLETAVLPGLINPRKPATFVVKDTLVKGLIWGPIMRALDPIPLSRKDARKDLDTVYSEGLRHIANGRSMIIFPEGSRRLSFDSENFNSLGIKLALKAQIPVIPIAVKTDFWGSGTLIKGFGRLKRKSPICFAFGEPIYPEGRGKIQHEQVISFIKDKLRSWGSEVVETKP